MRPGGAAPLIQHGPFTFNDQSRRVEEQLAFHERYHDRMTRLVGGDSNGAGCVSNDSVPQAQSPVPSAFDHNVFPSHFCNPTPDYWADFAKKFEEIGVSRWDGVSQRCATTNTATVSAAAAVPPPPLPVSPSRRGDHAIPYDVRSATSGRLGALSERGPSPARVTEDGVLRRLDWLIHEKNEPETTEVIDLLREVEDVLAREENQKCEGPKTLMHLKPTGTVPSSPPLNLSHDDASKGQVDVASDPKAEFYRRGCFGNTPLPPPPPPPATTPTAAPSFNHFTHSAPLNRPVVAADWSHMSSCQQMEWYRTYYAWMMYYAQYYGAVLGAQQSQKPKKKRQKGENEPSTRRKSSTRTRTTLKDINRECMELASEVDRLKEYSRFHADRRKKEVEDELSVRNVVVSGKKKNGSARQRCPSSPHSEEEDDTLYRSDNRHSYLFSRLPGAHIRHSTSAPLRPQKASQGLTAPMRRDLSSSGRGKLVRDTSELNESEGEGSISGQMFDPPWLPPNRQVPHPKEQEVQRPQIRSARGPGARDISWLYKYDESEDEGRLSEERGEQDEVHTAEEITPPIGHQHSAQAYLQRPVKRGSKYERKRREIEQEKPRWCF